MNQAPSPPPPDVITALLSKYITYVRRYILTYVCYKYIIM